MKTGEVPHEVINHVPRVFIDFDSDTLGKKPEDVVRELNEGEPRIEILQTELGVTVSPNTLEPGEEKVIANRLKEILSTN